MIIKTPSNCWIVTARTGILQGDLKKFSTLET